MSTRPHILLSWTLRRARRPLLPFPCVHCHSGLAGAGGGQFRVNANGTFLDTWFLVACASCDRISTLTVHDRSPRHDRHSAEPRNSHGFLVRPAMSRRHGPEPGREARWPSPGPHHAAIRARSLMTGRELWSRPARSRRRG
ncbi:DUF1062 domain-containing protein [Micromonospora halotolerans]|uniref:DUF1062 domain-containing protein n=1 Tax=Micromonospora halotolerans TaxID=709879 RepID=A0ABY9ZUI8_9ACTN|nr:DUF1062 domain-containing protein [Micromonospora halotolerans]WNM38964.1 DUF1062 domain-containing protein [Micromonospora halotolerans]